MLGATLFVSAEDGTRKVSILTQLLCWVQRCSFSNEHSKVFVSILTQLLCWVQQREQGPSVKGVNVSILTQLLCWVQLNHPPISLPSDEFQSSPSFYAGCNACNLWKRFNSFSFNPHPAFMLGATVAFNARRLAFFFVSILTQLLCWVQLYHAYNILRETVSILTQLLCWVQQGDYKHLKKQRQFQSSPSFYAGCNLTVVQK